MGGMPIALRQFLDARFRPNPAFELVLFDRLPAAEREMLSGLRQAPDFYGVLRPLRPGIDLKSVCRDTALLLYTLQTPGPIPLYARDIMGDRCRTTVAGLVLDEVLEVDSGDGFLTGAVARNLLFEEARPVAERATPLTVAALKYAQGLELTDTLKLSSRLYGYNRRPVCPSWRRRLPSKEAVAVFLELGPGGRNLGLLDRYWSGHSSTEQSGWLHWAAVNRPTADDGFRRGFKLYISPIAECLPETFRVALDVLTETGARAFKVGMDVYGLLRPDKFVAYFTSREQVEETARRLSPHLRGIPGHAVPFSAALDDEGLLSCGLDPPRVEWLVRWQAPSWRRWVTDRLAVALISAQLAPPTSREPWQLALDRLGLEGVDTTTWVPASDLWDTPG
jgi:hypothetical protein